MRGCRVLAGGTLAATAQTGETEGVLGRGRAPAKLLQIRQWILHASSGRDQGWCTQSTPSPDGVRASPSRFSGVERAGRRIQRAPITFRPQLPPSSFFYPISFFSLTHPETNRAAKCPSSRTRQERDDPPRLRSVVGVEPGFDGRLTAKARAIPSSLKHSLPSGSRAALAPARAASASPCSPPARRELLARAPAPLRVSEQRRRCGHAPGGSATRGEKAIALASQARGGVGTALSIVDVERVAGTQGRSLDPRGDQRTTRAGRFPDGRR